jgi:hypothetical protein
MDMKKAGKRGQVPIIGESQESGGLTKGGGDGPITNSPLNQGHVSSKEVPMGNYNPNVGGGKSEKKY